MDHIHLQKIPAINRSKKHQRLQNFYLCTTTVLACSLFCSSPFWFPCLFSCVKLFFFVSIPKITSTLFNSKFIFILGNLIVVLLIGESKFFTSNSTSAASDAYYNEYMSRKKSLQTKKHSDKNTWFEEKASRTRQGANMEAKFCSESKLLEVEKLSEDLEGEIMEMSLPTEELNKRADDFIAKVNRRRVQEARLLLC